MPKSCTDELWYKSCLGYKTTGINHVLIPLMRLSAIFVPERHTGWNNAPTHPRASPGYLFKEQHDRLLTADFMTETAAKLVNRHCCKMA